MMNLLSCHYSMDTHWVEARFANCTMLHKAMDASL